MKQKPRGSFARFFYLLEASCHLAYHGFPMRFFIFFLLFACSVSVAYADIFGYTDEAGTLVLSDQK